MPVAANTSASSNRPDSRSLNTITLSMATTTGSIDKMMPAAMALVWLTPYSMQIEKRKLPRKDSRNSSPFIRRFKTGSCSGLRNQWGTAKAPITKRNQAKANTPNTLTKGLAKAT